MIKLPDFIEFEPLNKLRRLMNAKLVDINFTVENRLTEEDLKLNSIDGLENDNIDEIKILPDGTLVYKDRTRVLIYIRDVAVYSENWGNLPKFHIANCKTFKEMSENGKKERYVVSTRTNGDFKVNLIRNNKEESKIVRLLVCMNCLHSIQYKRFYNRLPNEEKYNIRDTFSIKEYFDLYPRDLIIKKPTYTDLTSRLNLYSEKWNGISKIHKGEKNYRCEKCNINLENDRKFLDSHHKDTLKYNENSSNLIALCIYCHSKEKGHGHIKNSERYKEFMKKYHTPPRSI